MPDSTIGVTVISSDQLKGNGKITKPGAIYSWDDYERHYLAEGDSWFSKGFKQMNISNQYWNDLSDALMDELAIMLRSFASIGTNLRLVDTLKNVNLNRAGANATGNSGDWLNEIHLNDCGKDKVAAYWATFL